MNAMDVCVCACVCVRACVCMCVLCACERSGLLVAHVAEVERCLIMKEA